ncbi:MAG: tyrosine-protein phosphatase [Oscillospiraceae bacterium]|nr:tyrosine-protein phosphatase [Oscillospiraceae bacterium]
MKRFWAVILALVLVLPGCAAKEDNAIYEAAEGEFKTQVTEKQLLLTRTPANNETVTLINQELVDFLDGHVLGKGLTVAEARTEDVAAAVPVTLTWTTEAENTGYTVIYTTKQDFSDAVEVKTAEPTALLEDLFVATTYYWQVVTHTASGDNYSTVFCFNTAETPRWLTIDGVTNARDLGGYVTADGKYRVKQGMIYRGTKFDAITEAGIEKVVGVYGLKSDLDLRTDTDAGWDGIHSPLGDRVKYISTRGIDYANSLSDKYAQEVRNEFLVFTDPDSYPLYAHCSSGRDRAGTLMFYVGALLGMSREQLLADYEMSYMSARSYAKGDTKGHDWMVGFLSAFEALEGDTYQEKAENFWLSLGITQEQIDTVRSIMLEPITE